MRRLTITTAVFLSLSAATSISFAGKWHNNENGGQKKSQTIQRLLTNSGNPTRLLSQQSLSSGITSANLVKKYKTHNKQDDNINNVLPLDTGRGDGRVPTDSKPTMPTGKPGFIWVGDHWERAKASTTGTSTPTGKPGFVWVGDHWERAKASVSGTSNSTGKPGFVWAGDHWERAKAPVITTSKPITTSKLMSGATISVIQSGQVSTTNSLSATRGVNGNHREKFNANGVGNPGIPPAFLDMANTPPPAISKPTWNSGQLPPGVTVRPGSPNRADVTGGGWEFPTITIKGELNPLYDNDRDHRN